MPLTRRQAAVGRAADPPLFGPLLYRRNVTRLVVGMMARGHVDADPEWPGGARLAEKLTVTRAPGARHAAIRFVAGELDPMRSRADFLAAAARIADPLLLLCGAGTLALHEEFPEVVEEALEQAPEAFLCNRLRATDLDFSPGVTGPPRGARGAASPCIGTCTVLMTEATVGHVYP